MEEDEDPGVNHDALVQDMPVVKKEKRGFPSRRKVRCNYCWKVIGIINVTKIYPVVVMVYHRRN